MELEKKNYLLYTNKNQENLLAFAESKDEIKEVSQSYTGGTWFEYDVEVKEGHLDILLNEKSYKGKPKFAKEVEKKEEKETDEKHLLHSGIGDVR